MQYKGTTSWCDTSETIHICIKQSTSRVTIKLSESGKIETSQKELKTAEYQDSEGMLERKQATGKALPYKMGYAWRCSARDKTRVRMAAQCKDEARVRMVA